MRRKDGQKDYAGDNFGKVLSATKSVEVDEKGIPAQLGLRNDHTAEQKHSICCVAGWRATSFCLRVHQPQTELPDIEWELKVISK